MAPSFWFTPDIYDRANKTEKIKSKIYLLADDSESDDIIPDLEKTEKIACIKSCDCKKQIKKVIVRNGKHNENLWRKSFVNAYLWLLD